MARRAGAAGAQVRGCPPAASATCRSRSRSQGRTPRCADRTAPTHILTAPHRTPLPGHPSGDRVRPHPEPARGVMSGRGTCAAGLGVEPDARCRLAPFRGTGTGMGHPCNRSHPVPKGTTRTGPAQRATSQNLPVPRSQQAPAQGKSTTSTRPPGYYPALGPKNHPQGRHPTTPGAAAPPAGVKLSRRGSPRACPRATRTPRACPGTAWARRPQGQGRPRRTTCPRPGAPAPPPG